jgi:hypothetical protein
MASKSFRKPPVILKSADIYRTVLGSVVDTDPYPDTDCGFKGVSGSESRKIVRIRKYVYRRNAETVCACTEQ